MRIRPVESGSLLVDRYRQLRRLPNLLVRGSSESLMVARLREGNTSPQSLIDRFDQGSAAASSAKVACEGGEGGEGVAGTVSGGGMDDLVDRDWPSDHPPDRDRSVNERLVYRYVYAPGGRRVDLWF